MLIIYKKKECGDLTSVSKVSKNIILFLKRDVILKPLPLKPPKGPPPRPAKTPKRNSSACLICWGSNCALLVPKERPVPTSSQTKAPVPASSQEEAPVSTATAEEVLVPARSPEKVLMPALSHPQRKHLCLPCTSRDHQDSVTLQGATKSTLKRSWIR